MKLLVPWFEEKVHWKRIPCSERNGRPWKYRLICDIHFRLVVGEKDLCSRRHYLFDGDGNHWGTITPSGFVVCRGYAWNGSSMSPDWKALLASLPHDLFYQFSGVPGFPLTRATCDRIFFDLAETPFRHLYWLGLAVGGWACWGQHEAGLHIISEPCNYQN